MSEPDETGIRRFIRPLIRRRAKPRPAAPVDPARSEELLARAARCYAAGGRTGDATRLFQELGDDRSAGPLLELQGQHSEAAECFVRCGDWRRAGQAYLRCGQYLEAGECQSRSGEPLEAAWTFVHLAGLPHRALSLLPTTVPETELDNILTEVVRARCEAALGSPREAARRARNLLLEQGERAPFRYSVPVHDRLIAVTEVLERPDLTAMVHANAVNNGYPKAREAWEQWAETTFGEALGLPPGPPEAEESEAEFLP